MPSLVSISVFPYWGHKYTHVYRALTDIHMDAEERSTFAWELHSEADTHTDAQDKTRRLTTSQI